MLFPPRSGRPSTPKAKPLSAAPRDHQNPEVQLFRRHDAASLAKAPGQILDKQPERDPSTREAAPWNTAWVRPGKQCLIERNARDQM